MPPPPIPDPPLPGTDLELILEHTRPLWEEMRNQRIFITGGTGFFGTWLLSSFLHAQQALSLNAKATVLTRNPAQFATKAPRLALHPAITLLQGDTSNFSMPDGRFDFVLHAATDVATPAHSSTSSPLARYASIADGTARVLEFAATHGTRKLLLTSSGAVYGRQPASLSHIPEDYSGAPDPLAPASAYGEAKRASELMCALYAQQSQLQCKIARCFAFVGPGLPLDANFAIGNFIRDALRGQPIQIAGDGTTVRSYLYAADLTIWLWTILFSAPPLQAFNVGSEDSISLAELARLTAARLQPQLPIHIAKSPAADAARERYVPSTQRSQQQLHLRQTVSLTEAIRRTADWHGMQSSG